MTDPFAIITAAMQRKRFLLLLLLAEARKPVSMVDLGRRMHVGTSAVWHHAQCLQRAGLVVILGTRARHSRFTAPASCTLGNRVSASADTLYIDAAGVSVAIGREIKEKP